LRRAREIREHSDIPWEIEYIDGTTLDRYQIVEVLKQRPVD
jgi:hypothetical protein